MSATGGEPLRVPLVVGNWKMNKTIAEAESFIAALLPQVSALERAEVGIAPPFTALAAMVDSTRGSRVAVFAQNMHQEASGAYTGEVSVAMLVELDLHGVVLGHSERRQLFCETDEALAAKVPAALDAGLVPILCVGETERQYREHQTRDVLRRQVTADLANVEDDRLSDVVIAYEPIWAIGTGNVATPEQAQDACAFIRGVLAERDPAAAERVRILYGGSVKPDNAAELCGQPDLDGALVGGASLDPGDFAALAQAAERS